ncbi:MAG: amidohydrolase family protein [Ilumatobacter sp.]|uniref:amidohydrolase family protein n=1 Tax=Ilumatobacter sp. TaxID=1967498 RepID=UPI00391DB753
MIDDIHVFDCVIHLHDMSNDNLDPRRADAWYVRDMQVGMGEMLRPLHGGDMDYATATSVEDMYRLVFEESPTDLAMAQVVPVFDWYPDFWAPVKLQHAMAEAYPDHVLFCGGVDPAFRGVQFALEEIERQTTELGAVSFKFYNGHLTDPWRCDDEEVAYPLYEKCREMGVNVVQFHKGVPFGTENLEWGRPNDLQAPCRDFPEMSFVMHHLAMPYFDETVAIAGRFPNMYLALSANLTFTAIAPRQVQWQMGNLLAKVGVDKLIYGSEAALAGPPAPYIQAFLDLEIPEDLCDGWGFPQITRDDKRKILGENFARVMGIDLAATVAAR